MPTAQQPQPIVIAKVAQLLMEDYKLSVDDSWDSAKLLIDRLSKRDLQIIKGAWIVPEVIHVIPTTMAPGPGRSTPPHDRWAELVERTAADAETLERQPWLAKDIQ